MSDTTTPPYLMVHMFKSCYYPIRDIIGEFSCHVIHMYEVYSTMSAQCHTFFVTLFRYICLFHDDKLMRSRLTAQGLARLMCLMAFLTPLSLAMALLQGSPPTVSLNRCIGHTEIEKKAAVICDKADSSRVFLCQTSFFI